MTQLEQPIQSEVEGDEKEKVFDGEQNTNSFEKEQSDVYAEAFELDNDSAGSNTYLGKFNSVKDLEDAYNSLQAEFTRKCQKLKALEEELTEGKQKILDNSNTQDNPIYLKEDYAEQLDSFLQSYPLAKKYAKEISLEVMNNKSLDLYQAYNNVLASKFKEPEELVKDKNFIDNYILNDDNLKKELIKKYLKDVKESNAPTLITGAGGLGGGRAKDIEISSLEEANKLALKMFRG